MKKAEELTVITKTYDLIRLSCNHTSKFPRNHRFVLGERIERNLLRAAHAAARGKCLTPGREISPRILDPRPQQQMGAQRCS